MPPPLGYLKRPPGQSVLAPVKACGGVAESLEQVNNPRHLECVPTEYRGIEFRSKSEAILARNFDLLSLLWMYEPRELMQSDLWCPDFWIITPSAGRPGFLNFVIEYKPRDPTKTFRKRLGERFDQVATTIPFAECWLFIADPFDANSNRSIELWRGGQWWGVEPKPFFDRLTDARGYRFDLQEVAA